MKKIGSIHIDNVPIGMLILNKKNKKFYISSIDRSGNKEWKRCDCPECTKFVAGKFINNDGFLKKPNQSISDNLSRRQTAGTTSTNLAPSPEQHSWHHHHAPFYQVFNNYVCLKRDTLGEIRDFFMEMFSHKNYLERKIPFSN
jgi:hypothetical protein